MVKVCRMCKIPGIQTRNSVKSSRKADLVRLNKYVHGAYDYLFDYGDRNHGWDMLCVPHNCDMTKNRHHDGTKRKMMYQRDKYLKI